MEVCAAILLGFPPDGDSLADNEKYDKEVRSHVSKLSMMLKEQLSVVQQNAAELLEVRPARPARVSAPSDGEP